MRGLGEVPWGLPSASSRLPPKKCARASPPFLAPLLLCQVDPEMSTVTGVRSALGEAVSFRSPLGSGAVDPNGAAASHESSSTWGVETWLGLVDAATTAATGRAIDECILATRRSSAQQQSRVEWALESGPGQAVLVAAAVLWTAATEAALRGLPAADGGPPDSLPQWQRRHQAGLDEVLAALRSAVPASSIASAAAVRVTLSNLAMHDIHGRDVLSALVRGGGGSAGGSSSAVPLPAIPASASDFSWQSQLRYYWTPRSAASRLDSPGTVVLEAMRARITYGNEFLGSTTRLVATPLVDRCQRALLSAFAAGTGAALCGPTGAGKSAVVRDVAHAAGSFCVAVACGPDTAVAALTQVRLGEAGVG